MATMISNTLLMHKYIILLRNCPHASKNLHLVNKDLKDRHLAVPMFGIHKDAQGVDS